MLERCFGVVSPRLDPSAKVLRHDIDLLYDAVKTFHDAGRDERDSSVLANPQHASLLPGLRQYQIDAVKWMLGQER